MPANFTRATERFRVFGVDLNNPTDSVRAGYYPILENVRAYTDGIIQQRQGLSIVATVSSSSKTPVHSVRRLNDPLNSSWARIVGIQDTLSYGQSSFTRAQYNVSDVIYDGNPLIMIPYRPDQAVVPWMYVAANVGHNVGNGYKRQLKISRTGTVKQWGMPAPIHPPTVSLGALQWVASTRETLTNADFGNTTGWTADGTVILNAAPAPSTINRVSTTITATNPGVGPIYDSGTTGWCSIVIPAASLALLGVGSQVRLTNVAAPFTSSDVIIHEIYPGTSASNTISIASIIYDSNAAPANTTIATIQADKAVTEIKPNAIVLLNAAVYARVISVKEAADGTTSFRCLTNNTTILAAQTISVVGSFRTYTTANFRATDTVVSTAISVQSGTVAGTGYIGNNITLDLSSTKVVGGRALLDDDFVHLSLQVSNLVEPGSQDPLSRITSGRVLFNCDVEGTPSFTKNFFQLPFRPSDLITLATGSQTAVDATSSKINRRVIGGRIRPGAKNLENQVFLDDGRSLDPIPVDPNNPNTPLPNDDTGTQTGTGHAQWHELRFRVGDLKAARVGTDLSRGLSNINGFRLELTLVSGAAIVVNIGSLTAWGTYPLDSSDLGAPYIYRYRLRDSTTGARSNYSPPCFSGVMPLRGSVVVTAGTIGRSGSPIGFDKYDWERTGGSLTGWIYVGTSDSVTFTDIVSDEAAVANAPLSEGDTNYQLWPTKQAPISGVFSTVAGTMAISTTQFNSDMAKGTPIRVQRSDGTYVYTTVRRVMDQSLANSFYIELADSIGSSTSNVNYEIPEPLYTSTPLPSFWVWNDRGFACGDSNNPGTLYWTNGNDIEGTQDTFYLEITNPSEPLINGCAFNGKNYVWSSERMFEIEQLSVGEFIAIEVPGRKGLASRHGLAIGDRIWYVSRDGIYQTGGGDSISITDDTLKPLFVTEGNAGQAVNGFNPPDFTQTTKLRLSYYDGYLYFCYQDTAGSLRTLVYTVKAEKPGWWPDSYLSGRGVTYLYGEEGDGVHSLLACGNDAITANLYQVTGNLDNTSAISCHVRTQSFDGQDRRALKDFGDLIVEADSVGANITPTGYLNNASTTASLSPTVLSTSTAGRTQTIIDISSGQWVEARNFALDLAWSSTSTGAGVVPKLYFWEPSYLVLPENSINRATYWDNGGLEQDKFWQGVEIWTDTSNVARTIRVEYDGQASNLADTLTVQHNGHQMKVYAFHPAFIAHNIRLRPTDSNPWKTFSYKWIFQPEPPAADRWETQQTSFGAEEYVHMKAAYVSIRSTTACTLTVTRTEDGAATNYTIPTTSGQRARVYVPFAATKGKSFSFTITSTSQGSTVRVYKDDTTVLVKPWASEQQFANRNPFGAQHGDGAAPV